MMRCIWVAKQLKARQTVKQGTHTQSKTAEKVSTRAPLRTGERTHKVRCRQVVAGGARGGGRLGVVVVLLGGALDRAAQQAAPHGEVDGGHAQASNRADHTAHPLERVELVQCCSTQGTWLSNSEVSREPSRGVRQTQLHLN